MADTHDLPEGSDKRAGSRPVGAANGEHERAVEGGHDADARDRKGGRLFGKDKRRDRGVVARGDRRPDDVEMDRGREPHAERAVRTRPARTSAAAAFALVLGSVSLLCVLVIVLSPVGLVLAILGIIFGVAGLRAGRRIGITGRGVAATGLVLSVLALIGSIAIAVGVTFFLNNGDAVQRIQTQLDKAHDNISTQLQK